MREAPSRSMQLGRTGQAVRCPRRTRRSIGVTRACGEAQRAAGPKPMASEPPGSAVRYIAITTCPLQSRALTDSPFWVVPARGSSHSRSTFLENRAMASQWPNSILKKQMGHSSARWDTHKASVAQSRAAFFLFCLAGTETRMAPWNACSTAAPRALAPRRGARSSSRHDGDSNPLRTQSRCGECLWQSELR